MKRINYKSLRRVVFSAYILITVLFCMLLVYLGRNEISKARSYAENERAYTESLLACRGCLNSVEKMFFEFNANPASSMAEKLKLGVREFRLSISMLAKFEKKRRGQLSLSVPQLKERVQLLHSISFAIAEDVNAPPAERKLLLGFDKNEFSSALDNLRGIVQTLLKSELDNVEIWQRQSFYFFNRMQYLLIVFFVLTTLFTLTASFLFSNILKSSLKILSDGAREISEGNMEYRFGNIQNDEIGGLMYDFNLMALRLQRQSDALHDANRDLTEKAELLIEAHQHRDRFLANMSHELRTPLNSVIGFAELLIERAEKLKPEKTRSYAKRMLAASEHLLDLISDLLEVAKIDAGTLNPVFSNFNLSLCVEEICDMLRPIAEKKNLELKRKNPADMPICADRRLVRQILINLINNALKFTHEGGVTVKLSREGDEYRIDVVDTGIGIAKKDLRQIFKDFHRVETGLTSNYEGVGIGLTLSKRLVELHEGRIIVSSETGKGSSFSVFLPIENKEKIKEGNSDEEND